LKSMKGEASRDPELKVYVRLIIRRSWFIGLLAVLFCGAAYAQHTLYSSPRYEATTKILVNSSKPAPGLDSVDINKITSDIMLIDTYKEVLMTNRMMDKVIALHPEFGLADEQLASMLKVGSSEKSQVMSLTITDHSALRAAQIVNAVTDVFRAEIPHVLNVDNISILSEAKLSSNLPDKSLSLVSELAAAFFLSLVVAIAIIFLREYWDDKIRNEQDVLLHLNKPTLARITKIRGFESRSVPVSSSKKAAGDPLHVGYKHQA